jgi:hypothetical protein
VIAPENRSSSLKENNMASRLKRLPVWLAVGAATIGAGVGGAAIAGAASNTSTPVSTAAAGGSSGTPTQTAPDPATVAHGPGETLLTGSTAEKVKAAALAAVPGATVIRVETDSAGSPYEAHLTKADGTDVTVKVDANFKATTTEDGFGGGGPHGGTPPTGAVSG